MNIINTDTIRSFPVSLLSPLWPATPLNKVQCVRKPWVYGWCTHLPTARNLVWQHGMSNNCVHMTPILPCSHILSDSQEPLMPPQPPVCLQPQQHKSHAHSHQQTAWNSLDWHQSPVDKSVHRNQKSSLIFLVTFLGGGVRGRGVATRPCYLLCCKRSLTSLGLSAWNETQTAPLDTNSGHSGQSEERTLITMWHRHHLELTSFLTSWGRSVQWSNGIPWISSAVRTLFVLSSGIMAGTENLSSPASSSLSGMTHRRIGLQCPEELSIKSQRCNQDL